MNQLLDYIVLFFNLCLMLVSFAESTLQFESKRQFDSRWIERNGTDREFSHVIFISMTKATDGNCSGTMIHERWVLTAARCLYGDKSTIVETDTSLTLYAGVDDVDNLQSTKVQERKSKKVRVHNVKGLDSYYSVALVEVAKPFDRTSKIVEDILVSDKGLLDVEDKVCKVGGFGYKTWNNRSTVLKCQEVEWYEDNNETCPCAMELSTSYSEFSGEWFCGKSSVGLCKGDFGAGLICDETLQAVAVGLVAIRKDDCDLNVVHMDSQRCGGETTWGIYADICYHLEWIHKYVPTVEFDKNTICRSNSASSCEAHLCAIFVLIIILLAEGRN